ncbi:hypothetical protein CRG98_030472, partial [Punica granatum]
MKLKAVRFVGSVGGLSSSSSSFLRLPPRFFLFPHQRPRSISSSAALSSVPRLRLSSSSTTWPPTSHSHSHSHSLLPQLPLFLRPPKYAASLSDLQIWHDWAKSLAAS